MIRVIRFTALGALVLALGLGPIGCGGETSTTAKDSGKDKKAVEDAKKEAMKKAMEGRQKEKAGGAADEKDKATEDKPKTGDKDKDRDK